MRVPCRCSFYLGGFHVIPASRSSGQAAMVLRGYSETACHACLSFIWITPVSGVRVHDVRWNVCAIFFHVAQSASVSLLAVMS